MEPCIRDIISALEVAFPLNLQEKWDNSGLQLGDPSATCTGVLVAVEATEATLQECISRGCNLLITHHPILFHPLQRLSTESYIERTIALAIKNDIAIYASHTAVDNTLQALNARLADRLELRHYRPLLPAKGQLFKLSVMVPTTHEETLKKALFDAGAGALGNYRGCCFTLSGTGEFTPSEGADPFIGSLGETCHVAEQLISMLVPEESLASVLAALRKAHPYEEPAYEFFPLANTRQDAGTGLVGDLSAPQSEKNLLQKIASWPHVMQVAHSKLLDQPVQRVAVVSGSGGSFLKKASASGCQILLTGEAKYNDYLDAAGYGILLITIGHFESEKVACSLFIDIISKKFSNFVVAEATTDINPVKYFPGSEE